MAHAVGITTVNRNSQLTFGNLFRPVRAAIDHFELIS
jgi:hypothetical protein